ncbi:O-antigen ligase family protein [Erythrobacteraceae bacterium WH01K]|nr:O-antigen ligase family protein [Erythrobacteraceae bacterium WH01K]
MAAGIFAALVLLTGGASRGEVPQLALLYPGSILLLAFVAIRGGLANLGSLKIPALLLGGYMLWTLAQLIPLPHAIWSSLPQRAVIAEIDDLVGLGQVWRPITFAPERTLSTFFGLFTPLAALLIAATLPMADRQRNLRRILLLAIGANAILALVHAVLGGDALHFYEISNDDRPVGFFANVNHSVVLSAIGIVLCGMELAVAGGKSRRTQGRSGAAFIALATGVSLLCFVHLLIGGSRQGLIVMLPALLAAFAVFLAGRDKEKRGSKGAYQRKVGSALDVISRHRVAVLLALPALMTGGFLLLGEIPALSRLYDESLADNVRWTLYSPLIEMVSSFWLLGSGMGSFEDVYYMFETSALLAPFYVNQAHNDWLQIIIEGGVPAIALLACALILIGRRIFTVFRLGADGPARTVAWMAIVVILSFASLVDYPLRTPLFQTTVAWLFVMLDSAAFSRGARARDEVDEYAA